MNERRWKASWRDQKGYVQEYRFTAPDNRMLARIDFQLKWAQQGRPIPNNFALEEGHPVIHVAPKSQPKRNRVDE